MLWYKAWLETRWRFLIGLALLVCSAAGVVFEYPRAMKLLAAVPDVDTGGIIGERIRESMALAREYRGYVWSQWFAQNLKQTWTVFAVLLGTGGVLAQSSGGAALFTLSMPASRNELLAARAATGLAELLVLAVVPSTVIPLASPLVGGTFGLASVLVYALCLFVAGAVFFSLAFLLSTIFADIWRPLSIALVIAIGVGVLEELFRDRTHYGIFGVMAGQSYFYSGHVPWLGLGASAAASAAMLYGAALNIARHDF
jgi:ABC-2 type transport system permease protein